MKEFLLKNFQTTNISDVDSAKLKNLLEGDHLVERIGYRKKVAINGHKEAIAKGTIIRTQNKSATEIQEKDRNRLFGFPCLHYSVSEGAGMIKVKVVNKSKAAGSVHVKSRGDTATEGEDYVPVDELIEFKKGEREREINIKINDEDEWEPDEDFYLDLLDPTTKGKLHGGDTTTRITIIDDDKPGDLVFKEKRSLKHPANESICYVDVHRINGCDGKIKCKYRTTEIDQTDRTAIPGKHYTAVNGTLEFDHNQTKKTIEIPMLPRSQIHGGRTGMYAAQC